MAEARSGTWLWRGVESCGLKSGSLGWRVPHARPADGNVSTVKVTTPDRRLPAPARLVSSAPPSSSDGTGTVSFASVEAPAPPGAASGAGESAAQASKPQRRRGRHRGRGRRLRRRRSRSAAGGGAGGEEGGRVGSSRATPAPEPSLGLASHVKLERLVACLLQTFKGCCLLVIANAGNPAVVGPEVRSEKMRKSGS